MRTQIRVAELFAGVGGFRLGLEGYNGKSPSSGYIDEFETPYITVWSNQYEPSTTVQHASSIYEANFGSENHVNADITSVSIDDIPDHDLLVGGFPCQDYSVAKGFKATGIHGTKGALWWAIHRILSTKNNPPKYLFLENVDRLRNNPFDQRGRDFAIVLASLADLGYIVEWRVINSAEYGMPQRRKRIYLVAYHESTNLGKEFSKVAFPSTWLSSSGVLAQAFPLEFLASNGLHSFQLHGSTDELTKDFQLNGLGINAEITASSRLLPLGKTKSPFQNAGVISGRTVNTCIGRAKYNGSQKTLRDVIFTNGCVPEEFFINHETLEKWRKLKGSKNVTRTHAESGFTYQYAEGSVTFPDSLDLPSRTIVTGEGGSGASRFKHVILHPLDSRFRRLTPIEIERLNMFPDDFTKGISETRRAFLMGNSVIVGVIERIGKELARRA